MTSSTPGHNPTPNMIWWSWNANSGDTGGIVKDDWKEINWNKVAWLQKAAGLQPWALGVAGKLPGATGPSPVIINGVPSAYGTNSMFDQSGGAKPAPPAPVAPAPPAPVAPVPPAAPAAPSCVDKTTPDGFSCEQQKSWGKCSADWFVSAGFCQKTCGRCPPAAAAPKLNAVEESVPAEPAAAAGGAAAGAAAVPGAVPAAAAAAPATAAAAAAAVPRPLPAPAAVPASSAAVEGAPEPLAAGIVAPIAPAPSSSAFPYDAAAAAATSGTKATDAGTKAMLKDAGALSLKPGRADATLADAAQIARILEAAPPGGDGEAAITAAATVLEGRTQAEVAAVVAQLRAAAAIETVMEAAAATATAVDEAALFGAAKAAAAEALLE